MEKNISSALARDVERIPGNTTEGFGIKELFGMIGENCIYSVICPALFS